jgi:hypothetical protein
MLGGQILMSNTKFVIDEIKKLELKDKETDEVIINFDTNKFDFETFDQAIQNFAGYTIDLIPRPKENEVIVMTFDTEKWDVDQAYHMFERAKEFFGEANIIAFFDGVKLECDTIDNMIEALENMKK